MRGKYTALLIALMSLIIFIFILMITLIALQAHVIFTHMIALRLPSCPDRAMYVPSMGGNDGWAHTPSIPAPL